MSINKYDFFDIYYLYHIRIKLMRKTHYNKQMQREKNFDLSFHVNDVPLPTYNAFKDPFLNGFFQKS